jgi:SAM-dependent methyltransferase
VTTPWSHLGEAFLRDDSDWAIGQGPDAPDRQILREILEGEAPCSILDVGCGTGITLDAIVGVDDVAYTGLDYTPEFIEACRARYPGASFICDDLYNLIFRDPETFDVVATRGVLEHVTNPLMAFQILYRLAARVLVVAFFISPGEEETEVTDDGFIQRRCDRLALMNAIHAARARHTISEYEHAGQQWSVWQVWRP